MPVAKHWAESLLTRARSESLRRKVPFWVMGAVTTHDWHPNKFDHWRFSEQIPMGTKNTADSIQRLSDSESRDYLTKDQSPSIKIKIKLLKIKIQRLSLPVAEFNGNSLYSFDAQFQNFLQEFAKWFKQMLDNRGAFDTWIGRFALTFEQGPRFLSERLVSTPHIVNCDRQGLEACMARNATRGFDGWGAVASKTVLLHAKFMNNLTTSNRSWHACRELVNSLSKGTNRSNT